MKLLTLHSDILLHFLNTQFSLQELIHLRFICREFCYLIESRHCIGYRRTLKLFWSFDDFKRYSLDLYYLGLENVPQLRLKEIGSTRNDDLLLNGSKFCEATCNLLIRLLPRLEHLTIFFTHNDTCFPDYLILCQMFRKLSGQLTGLSLFGKFNHSTVVECEKDPGARVTMGEAINQFTSLKHLDMCLENLFEYQFKVYFGERLDFIEKTLCAQLDGVIPRRSHLTFCFKTSNFEQQIISHLGSQCTSLRLHRVNPSNNNALIERMRDCSIELTHLRLTTRYCYPITHLTRPLSNKNCFAQLRSLELIYFALKYFRYYPGLDMQSLLHLLVPLRQLSALTMIGFKIENCHLVSAVLSQITSLSINAGYHQLNNEDAWFQDLSRVFPKVHRLTLAFHLSYTIDLSTHVSRNFVHCIYFRMLNLQYNYNIANMSHTVPSVLASHHQRKLCRQYDHGIKSLSEENEHEVEQLWKRKSTTEMWTQVLNFEQSLNSSQILVWNAKYIEADAEKRLNFIQDFVLAHLTNMRRD